MHRYGFPIVSTKLKDTHTAWCSPIYSANRTMSLASYGGDLFGKFFNNSVQRDRKEITHIKVAKNHIPESLEEDSAREGAKNKAKKHLKHITEVLDRLQKGEDPKQMWGTMKDFLGFVGLGQSILHEKALIRYMRVFDGSCHECNTEIFSLAQSLHDIVRILRNEPLIPFSGLSNADASEFKSCLARVLCAIALAAHEENMPNEGHRMFEEAKFVSTHSTQVSGILCLEASVFNRLKRFNEACLCARKAIKMSSGKNCMSYFQAAHALASLGNVPQAIRVLDDGLASINDERQTKLSELRQSLVSRLKQEK